MSGAKAVGPIDRTRRFNPYPSYKDSGIDWLGTMPSGWQLKRLKFVWDLDPSASEVRGMPLDTEVSFVPMEAVGQWGELDLSRTKAISDANVGYTYFRNGDVVVAKITPCFENGKGALARDLTNGIALGTTELHVLRASRGADPKFLCYVTLSDAFRRLGEAHMYGAGGQKRVPGEFVENLKHPIPTLPEQRTIAAFLDRETARIDALVAKKERLIELLQEKRTALITGAVTKGLDPNVPVKDSCVEWLGEIPAHWGLAPVNSRYSVELGKMLDAKRVLGNSSGQYLRNVDVQWDAINIDDLPEMDFVPSERDRYSLRVGDVLICEGGEVGRSAIWNGELDECFYQKALHRARPRVTGEHPRFLLYLMCTVASRGVFAAGGNQNTIDHLTAVQLRHYRFPFPPPDEQRAIAAFLDQESARIDGLVTKVRDAIDRLTELRTALIAAAVTGKIDVRTAA